MRRAEWGLGRETPDFVCCDPREVVKCRFAVPGDPDFGCTLQNDRFVGSWGCTKDHFTTPPLENWVVERR